jgi:hypothetical protein
MQPTLEYVYEHCEKEELREYYYQEHQKALDSYPIFAEIQYCYKCGEPIVYNSISYMEGFHIDC